MGDSLQFRGWTLLISGGTRRRNWLAVPHFSAAC